MEKTNVKCEVNPGRRRMCMADGKAAEIKCLKRRRRAPLGVVISCDDHHEQQQQQQQQPQPQPQQLNQSSTSPTVKRSSRFRGVSRHRWTGRFEAHLWDKGSWNVTQKKKGKQVYLGAYDEEESAARAYDLAALKYWGRTTFTNFPVSDYEEEIELMHNVTKEEYLASLRRKSSGFSRGVSKYRGVARHHHNGRWEARIGRVFGNKYLYLGTYSTQEEAAHAYDIAAIEYRGINAVTNFDLSTYIRWLRPGTNAPLTSQEQQTIVETRPLPTASNLIPNEETESFFQTNPFSTNDLGSQKRVVQQIKSSSSSCTKSSSPTALSLLLRSSIFRDLVEKNSNSTSIHNENEGDDIKPQPQMGSDDEYGGMFYEGIEDVPYECSTSNTLPELQEQPLWNGVLRVPSTH